MGIAVQQRLGRHDHAGGAEAALNGARINEGLLQRVGVLFRADALNGLHPLSVRTHREHTAGIDGPAVHDYGTRTALSQVAALLGSGQARPLPQYMQECLLLFYGKLPVCPV